MFVLALGAVMIGLHGFSFLSSGPPPKPKPVPAGASRVGASRAGVVTAVMPDGTVIAWHASAAETWAGVAKLDDGKWAVLADGTARGSVTTAAAASWTAHKGEYQAKWAVVPVTAGK